MSYEQSAEREVNIDLFNPIVKGRVDSIQRLWNQLERCNILLGTADEITFESSVLALKGDLPLGVKQAVLARQSEFNKTITEYNYLSTCGINAGTPDNPLVQVRGHPEWDFLIDIPLPWREKYEDRITILSPRKNEYTKTDYIELFEIIKEEIEKAGASWQYEKKTGKAMKVEEELSREIVNIIVDNRVGLLQRLRELYPHKTLGYRDLNVGWDRSPATPVYGRDEK